MDAVQVRYEVDGHEGSRLYVHQGFYEVIMLMHYKQTMYRRVVACSSTDCTAAQGFKTVRERVIAAIEAVLGKVVQCLGVVSIEPSCVT